MGFFKEQTNNNLATHRPILGCSSQVNFQLIVQTPIDNDPHTFSNTSMMRYISYSAFVLFLRDILFYVPVGDMSSAPTKHTKKKIMRWCARGIFLRL